MFHVGMMGFEGDLGKQQREFDTEMIPAAASQAAAAEKIMLLESTLGRVHEESETAEVETAQHVMLPGSKHHL